MTRYTTLLAFALTLNACAQADEESSTGGSAPSADASPPATDAGTANDTGGKTDATVAPDTAPTGPCGTVPADDGLSCTRFVCIDGAWKNTTLCVVGEACTDKGCVSVAPGPEASDAGTPADTMPAPTPTPTPSPTPTPTPPPPSCGPLPDGDYGLGCVMPTCNVSTGKWEFPSYCKTGETCDMGKCIAPTPVPTPTPSPMVHKPTLDCSKVVDGQYTITLGGIYVPAPSYYPISEYPGGLVSSISDPGYIQYNSDYDRGLDEAGKRIQVAGAWNSPYKDGKAMWGYGGEGVTASTSFKVPTEMDSFTLYMANTTMTSGSWFQNDKWILTGSCHFCDSVAKDKICH